MFSENSIVVKVWVKNVKEGSYTREQVPELSNLRDVVLDVLGPEE
jgi:hypothetical protein